MIFIIFSPNLFSIHTNLLKKVNPQTYHAYILPLVINTEIILWVQVNNICVQLSKISI